MYARLKQMTERLKEVEAERDFAIGEKNKLAEDAAKAVNAKNAIQKHLDNLTETLKTRQSQIKVKAQDESGLLKELIAKLESRKQQVEAKLNAETGK